uniref:Uncharacterized protein n=1 Tax=Rhodnius prolixus TaxID=13249 RepID=T1IF19_RHOPR
MQRAVILKLYAELYPRLLLQLDRQLFVRVSSVTKIMCHYYLQVRHQYVKISDDPPLYQKVFLA